MTRKTIVASTSAVALLASLMLAPTGARAQAAQATDTPDSASAEVVVVTGQRVARGNNVITPVRIETLAGGQNIVDAIKLVPGVSIRGSDTLNNDPWTYAINIRGFEVNQRSSKVGQTLDGMPLFNASYYLGGSPAQKYIISENVSQIVVSQGTADVGSPASNALGGTLSYSSRAPSMEAGGLVKVTIGDFDTRRYFGRYDFGEMFGNTRISVSAQKLDAKLWPHKGSTPAAIEQFSVEGKSVTDFGKLTMTLFASYNDSDDDPIIELSRANINRLGLDVDGSSATWNTLNNAPNENWADDWAAVRENTFAYAKFNYDISDALSVEVAPYIQKNDGIGEFSPPGLQPRIVTNASGVREQVMFGNSSSRSRTATYQNAAGNAVFNYTGGVADTYRALDGSTVSSADCYNVDGTLKQTNGAPTCAQGQSYRNSLYYHSRSGVVINGQYEVGNHKIRAGVWFETMDRDFGRAWLRYDDIRKGPIIVAGSTYRQDFEQNFKTDLIKLHIADDWTVNDRLTVSLGLQHFIIDISGTTKDESRYAANGTYNGPTSASVNSDSEEILPSIGAVYDVTDHLQVFGGYSRNFGAIGDFALEKTGTDFKNLEPEITQNLEAGVRYTSSRIAAAATLFKTENDNAIIFLDETFASSTGGINYNVGTGGTYVNAPGGIETTGIEASARVKLTKELGAYLSLTSLNSEYSAAFNAANYGASRRTVVAAGNKVPGTPDILVGGALDYQKGPFKGTVTARYVGESEGDAQNRPELVVPSYTLVDVSGSYRLETANNGYVEAQIAINNITNERYIGGILDEFNQRYTPGAPRSVHFTLSVGF